MLSSIRQPLVRHIEPVDAALLEGDKIQAGHPLYGVVWINPKRVSGTPCFYGTRVPLKNLFDSLVAGETLEEFLDGFDGVTREQAQAVLSLVGDELLDDLESHRKFFLIKMSVGDSANICRATKFRRRVNEDGISSRTARCCVPRPTPALTCSSASTRSLNTSRTSKRCHCPLS